MRTQLTTIAAVLALAAPALGQTAPVTTLPAATGVEGDQWHVTYTPAKRIKRMEFTALDGTALSPDRIRPVRFLALDSGTVTERAEETVCLDDGAWTRSDTLTPGTDGGDGYYAGTAVEDHVCENEHVIPAYGEPAVVPCTATRFSLDCAGQSPMPDRVEFSAVSVDDDCRTSRPGGAVTVTFADDTAETGRRTLTDDDMFPCVNGVPDYPAGGAR